MKCSKGSIDNGIRSIRPFHFTATKIQNLMQRHFLSVRYMRKFKPPFSTYCSLKKYAIEFARLFPTEQEIFFLIHKTEKRVKLKGELCSNEK